MNSGLLLLLVVADSYTQTQTHTQRQRTFRSRITHQHDGFHTLGISRCLNNEPKFATLAMYSRTLTHSLSRTHTPTEREVESARDTQTHSITQSTMMMMMEKLTKVEKKNIFFPSLFVEMVHQYTKRLEFRFNGI